MAAPFAAATFHQRQAMNFYVYQPTLNIAITPDPFITRRHKIYAFILAALLALLQIQSSGNTPSPFQVHPVTTEACVFGLLGYYLAFMAWLRLPQYASQLNIAIAAFGSFSLASLVTLLLPHSWWHIRYVFYFSLAVIELHPLLTVLYDRYVKRSMWTMWRSWQPNSTRHLLPLRHMDLMRAHNNNAYLMGAPVEFAATDLYLL